MMGESAADTAASRWECLLPLKRSQWVLALSCILLYLTLSGPCSMKCPLFIYVDGLQEFVEYDASLSFGHEDGCHEDVLFGDVRSTHLQDDSPSFSKLNKICANSNHFCFLSTLSCFNVVDRCKGTFSAESDNMVAWTTTDVSHPPNVRETNSSWMPGYAAFVLSNGKVLSCSLSSARQDTFSLGNKKDEQSDFSSCDQPLLPKIWKLRGRASELEEDSEQVGFDFLDGNSSPRVEISPPSLEWGTRELYVPSVAFLNIKNSYRDSALHLYEPFSTDPQFYAYNFVEMSLEPGEASSIALVFLPRLLGRSSAHLVLQTSLGGFVIHASGLAVESPYDVGPLIDFDVSSDGHLSKNISLFNPFDGILYVEEVSAWIAISSENTSHSAHVACKTDDFQSSASMNFNDVLDVKGNKMNLMGVKPKGNWEINPLDRETFVEISFPAHIQGSIFGAFCMRLKTFSKEIPDTIVLPIEVDVSSAIPQFSSGSISVFFEFLGPGDAQGPASFTLSLLNGASHLLRVVDIIEDSEGMKLLHVRFMKGLILYPETTTRIASVTYAPLIDTEFSDHDSLGCKLLVITNDSTSPQIEIPCKDFVNRCSRNQHGSTPGASGNSCVELGGECAKKPRNTRTESLGNIGQNLSQTKSKLLEVAEADELILRNWRSHKTMSSISVLEDREIQFPVVQVGTRHFKWITVNNPSENPVLMQLILNSGTIIDQCKDSDEASVPFVSRFVHNDSADMSDGFLLPKSAITEAYVHPLGQALFGPIIFQPSNQCVWRSSLLIRNNLTGVEWLPVQGVGGSHSLVLYEGSNPVQRLEFNLDFPLPLNISPQKYMFTMESTSAACSRPLSKELYAINTGDLPVEVVRLDVSGSFCGLDGFLIHTCKGFSLEPGESIRLLISYQTDFSAAMVHRDLELAMATGILVIPMRANLSLYMVGVCRKSFFWTILRKLALVVIVSASITLMLFCRILPHTLSSGMEGCFLKNDSSIATISRTKKTSRLHRNPRNARSLSEVQKTEVDFVSQYPDCSESRDRELEDKQVRDIAALDHQKDNLVSSPTESMVVTEHTISESPPTNNLTVKIMKEKVRRRKKRNAGMGKGFAGKFEVSSSQSGNSTPSSPLSPHTTCTPRRMCPLSPDTPEQPFTKAASDISIDKEKAFLASMETILPEPETSKKCYDGNWLLGSTDQPSQPRKTISKPVLLPSATFPVSGWRAPDVGASAFLTSTSAIAPHARAPGSKLSKDDSVKSVERRGLEEEFTYDIWGNHFSEFNLLGNTNEGSPGRSVISPRLSDSWEGDSQSFFARGPLVLM